MLTALILGMNIMFTIPKTVHEEPVTIYKVTSYSNYDFVTVDNNQNLFDFYSGTGDWHKDDSATVTMVGDAIVNIR